MAKILSTVSSTSHAAQSVMARILATENIRVIVDPKMNTAAFDLKNRTLLLPQWKDMSKSVYDMLIGHEISHALHTPASGWRETCNTISGCEDHTSQVWQTASLYLNVVEDARIERLIQVKFPGFRRDFVAAYNELNDKNFFGVKGQNLNTLGFADRLNLYYKLGTIGSVGITFTAEEDAFIRRIDNATSFADSAQIAADLFKFCNEQKHKQSQQPQGQNGSGSGSQQPQSQQKGGQSQTSKGQQSQQPQSNDQQDGDTSDTKDNGGNMGGEEQRPGDGSDAQDGDADQGDAKQPTDSNKKSNTPAPVGSSHSNSDAPPAPMTQKNFNRNIENQVQQDKYTTSVSAPTALVHCNLDNAVIDCKKIVETMRKDCAWMFGDMSTVPANTQPHFAKVCAEAHKNQAQFAKESKKQVDLLMKQFELRKAAQIAKRESVRKTGVLDTVRMVNYKHSEDIFRRNIMLPEGKNHGLVMFVDWSGSMDVCLAAVVEQLMVLVEFCRRVGIPYEVFAFTTRNFTDGTDAGICADPVASRKRLWKGKTTANYEHENRDQVIETGEQSPSTHPEFALLNLLSSRLTRTEHTDMLHFLRAYVQRRGAFGGGHDLYFSPPARWELSGTALDETIVAAMQIVPAFKAANKLDIVNTVFLTDGETSVPYVKGEQLIDPATKAVYCGEEFINRETGRSYLEHSYSTNVLLTALRDITKSNVVGMFLTGHSNSISVDRWFRKEWDRQINMMMAGKSVKDQYARSSAAREARSIVSKSLAKQFNDDNCVVAEPGTTGYSEFFIIKSTVRVLGDESDPMNAVQAGASHAQVKKAFLKSFENKNKSRVLINRFMELIAR